MYKRNMTARSRVAFYQALGIDVWVLRGTGRNMAAPTTPPGDARPRQLPAASASGSLRSRSSPPIPSPPAPANAPPADAPRPEEAFRIHCFRYGRVFAAFAEDAWPVRRLLFDVAWALNGFRAAERDDFVFYWPQPGASADRGGKAFDAFFRRRTLQDVRVLLSGSKVATLLEYPPPSESCRLNSRLYVHPGALDAPAKRTLWRLIQELDRGT